MDLVWVQWGMQKLVRWRSKDMTSQRLPAEATFSLTCFYSWEWSDTSNNTFAVVAVLLLQNPIRCESRGGGPVSPGPPPDPRF